MKGFWNVMLVMALVTGCASSGISSRKTDQGWKESEITGYTFELVDNRYSQSFCFTSDGYVLAIIGEKSGGLAYPLFQWEIDPEGVLNIKEAEGDIVFKLVKVRLDENRAIVTNSAGQKETYLRGK